MLFIFAHAVYGLGANIGKELELTQSIERRLNILETKQGFEKYDKLYGLLVFFSTIGNVVVVTYLEIYKLIIPFLLTGLVWVPYVVGYVVGVVLYSDDLVSGFRWRLYGWLLFLGYVFAGGTLTLSYIVEWVYGAFPNSVSISRLISPISWIWQFSCALSLMLTLDKSKSLYASKVKVADVKHKVSDFSFPGKGWRRLKWMIVMTLYGLLGTAQYAIARPTALPFLLTAIAVPSITFAVLYALIIALYFTYIFLKYGLVLPLFKVVVLHRSLSIAETERLRSNLVRAGLIPESLIGVL